MSPPSVHEYNFENDTLIINYNFGNYSGTSYKF